MANSTVSESPSEVNNPTYSWNNQRWVAEFDENSYEHYVLRNPDTDQRLPFATAEKRQAFIDVWTAAHAAVDALAFAVIDSIAVKSRIIADQMRDENAIINSRLEVK